MSQTITRATDAAVVVNGGASLSLMQRARNRIAGVMASLACFIAFGGVAATRAMATTTNPTTDLVEAQFAELTTLLTTTLIPALFGLIILGIVVALAVKYLRKGAAKA